MQENDIENAASTYSGDTKKAKWPFFSVQQFCRHCSLAMHGSIEIHAIKKIPCVFHYLRVVEGRILKFMVRI